MTGIQAASLPGHVVAYDAAVDLGTVELENGKRLRISSGALGGAQPSLFQGVLVTGIAGGAVATATILQHGAMPLDPSLEPERPPVDPRLPDPGGPRAPIPPPPEDPANPELIQALLDNPDDVESYLVLGDRLQDQGHPRGELIALMARLEQVRGSGGALVDEIAALLDGNREALLGERFGAVDFTLRVKDGRVTLVDRTQRCLELGWRLGFVASARVADPWDTGEEPMALDWLVTILGHPSGRLLRELTVGLLNPDDPYDCYHDVVSALVEAGPRPLLRRLFIGDFIRPDEMEISWTGTGDLGPMWPQLPNLRDVILQAGDVELGRIQLPGLRSFEIRTGGLSRSSLQSIRAAHWPELTRLVIWFGDEAYGAECTLDDVEPLLSADQPGLRELGLMNCEFTDDICHSLVRSPLASQLTHLDLSLGTMSDEGARALVDGAERLPALRRLNVEESFLSPAGVRLLQERGWEVAARNQQEADDGVRYVSVGE